ncbi:MAG TPA: hypothetical protein VK203_26985 [Nostocaceae cyanobacterium]|nr:hypothetical protein [Nostocaceae cyanobacterium]
MSKKQHLLARKLWTQLRELITPIPEKNFAQLLDALKIWISSHPILLKNINCQCTALVLLLDGKISQLHFVKPTAGAFLKSIITADFYPPREIEDIIECLELVVREFALFTNWETCPICGEGYLEYWKDMNINEIVLCCSECGCEQYLHEEIINKDNLRLSILVPASKEDIKKLNL